MAKISHRRKPKKVGVTSEMVNAMNTLNSILTEVGYYVGGKIEALYSFEHAKIELKIVPDDELRYAMFISPWAQPKPIKKAPPPKPSYFVTITMQEAMNPRELINIIRKRKEEFTLDKCCEIIEQALQEIT